MAGTESSLSLLWHFFTAGQHVKTLLASAMADSPLTPDEYAVYSALFDLGPQSPTSLARLLGMPPTTMSHYVRALLSRDHARRRSAAQDRRSYVLELTPSGLDAHRAASQLFATANRLFREQLETDEEFLERALRHVGDAAQRASREAQRRAAKVSA